MYTGAAVGKALAAELLGCVKWVGLGAGHVDASRASSVRRLPT